MLLPSPGFDTSAKVLEQKPITSAGFGTVSLKEQSRYTPDSAYESGEDRHSKSKLGRIPYFTPPPETRSSSTTRKRKRMAEGDINGSHSTVNHRRKVAKSQVVFVDPDDAACSWWWPGVIVPKHEIPTFRQTVEGEVSDPKEGECLVVYFEDASYNIVQESDCKPFSPYEPPYTAWASGKNGKAFVADKAVVRAAACWESGEVPSGFSWLQDTSRASHNGSSGVNRKRGTNSVANSRRNSHATLARKDTTGSKDTSGRKADKAAPTPRKSQNGSTTVQPAPAASSSMPIVQLTTSGGPKPKSTQRASAHTNASRSASFKRTREDNTINPAGQIASITSVVCVKCGGQESKQRRTSGVRFGTKNVGHREGVIGTPLCKSCRELLDEILPAAHSVMMDEESSWRPERRQLRVLRHLLPESKTDRLLRHLKGLQEMSHREHFTSAAPNGTVQPVALIPAMQSAQALPFVHQYSFTIAPTTSTPLFKQPSVPNTVVSQRTTTEVPAALSPYASPPLSATAPHGQNQADRNETRTQEPAG